MGVPPVSYSFRKYDSIQKKQKPCKHQYSQRRKQRYCTAFQKQIFVGTDGGVTVPAIKGLHYDQKQHPNPYINSEEPQKGLLRPGFSGIFSHSFLVPCHFDFTHFFPFLCRFFLILIHIFHSVKLSKRDPCSQFQYKLLFTPRHSQSLQQKALPPLRGSPLLQMRL